MAKKKAKKIKKVKVEKSHDLLKLGVAPEDLKDFQRYIGGGFMMSDKQIKDSYAEYKKAQELNVEEHLEMVFMIPKVQGSLTEGGVVTVWGGTKQSFLDPIYMKSVMERAWMNLAKTWQDRPYFTEAPVDPKAKKSKYGYWKGQPIESYSVRELIEIIQMIGAMAKHAKNKNAEGLELL